MARLPKKIDRRWAKRNFACSEDVAEFFTLWPDGLKVTLKNLLRVAKRENIMMMWLPASSFSRPAARKVRQASGEAYRKYRTTSALRRAQARAIWAEYVRQGVNQ